MNQEQTQQEAQIEEGKRGRLYWLQYNLRSRLWTAFKQRKLLFSALALFVFCILLLNRAVLHPYFIELRKHSYIVVVLILSAAILLWLFRRYEWKGRLLVSVIGLALLVGALFWGTALQNYLSLYARYQSIDFKELDQLPISGYERIQPLNSVYSLAYERMTETEAPTEPNFVRVGDDYRWTLAVEPAYFISRSIGSVQELFSIPGTAPSADFSNKNRVSVNFEVGENLLFSRNSFSVVIRSFSPWHYLNYEPADVKYFTDEKGEWIQVVSLIRWKGLLFPRPEFGGVQIIRQREPGFVQDLYRALFGLGEWVPPHEIGKHASLKGEHVLPYEVSRYVANSLRFQEGFFAPLPGYHKGDVRIPDMAEDINNQPFTAYFEFDNPATKGLYHYFALEPFDPDKQGLNTSLFVPADGSSPIFIYKHLEQGGAMTGVSAIPAKVMESKKNYDWSRNRPVEHRPFIRDIAGARRFFWLTTVVTFKENSEEKRFIAGTVPDVVLTDAAYQTPVWVNPLAPTSWVAKLEEEMAQVWTD